MPTRELEPYVAMAPRIEAERAIALAERVAVGMGRLPAADHRATVARWTRNVGTGSVARAATPDQLAAMAKGAGIGFRVVTPKAADGV